MVDVWPVLPQWSHLGGGTGGGCMAGVTTVVTLRRMDCVAGVTTVATLMRRERWWLFGRFDHSVHT